MGAADRSRSAALERPRGVDCLSVALLVMENPLPLGPFQMSLHAALTHISAAPGEARARISWLRGYYDRGLILAKLRHFCRKLALQGRNSTSEFVLIDLHECTGGLISKLR
jgi:hypothetical protein